VCLAHEGLVTLALVAAKGFDRGVLPPGPNNALLRDGHWGTNNTFIVESFLPEGVDIRISLDPKFSKLRDLISGEEFSAQAAPKNFGFAGFGATGGNRLVCSMQIKPHSYRVLSVVP